MTTKTHKFTGQILYTSETSEGSSVAIDIRLYNKGCMEVPAADTYTFYGSTLGTGTFVALYSSALTPVAQALVAGAAGCFGIPDEVFRAPFIKITSASQRALKLAFKEPGA